MENAIIALLEKFRRAHITRLYSSRTIVVYKSYVFELHHTGSWVWYEKVEIAIIGPDEVTFLVDDGIMCIHEIWIIVNDMYDNFEDCQLHVYDRKIKKKDIRSILNN